MTQYAQSRLTMWRTLLATMERYKDVWKDNAAFNTAYEKLKRLISDMEKAGEAQQHPTDGITKDRDAIKGDAIELVLDLAGAARSYAMDHNMNDLEAQVSISRADIIRLPPNAQRDRLQSIVNAVKPFVEKMGDEGVDEDEIKEVQAAIDAYKPVMTATREAIDQRSLATGSIEDLLHDGILLMTKLKGLIRRFRRTSPEFVSAFNTARVIGHKAVQHRKEDTGGRAGGSFNSGNTAS